MGLFFSSKSKKEKIVAIFDIGSGSVGGSFVNIRKDKNPLVLFSARNEIKHNRDLDDEEFLGSMVKALRKTAVDLLDKKIVSPDNIFCILSSPWYISENKITNFTRDRKFIFTSKMADKLLENEVTKIINSHNVKYSDPFNLSNSPDIIEKHILSVYLDGKNILKPIGKACSNVSMNLVLSFSTKSCISRIKESINSIFHNEKIDFLSFASATHLVLRDKYTRENSFIILDVAGEISDMSLIEDGAIVKTVSFPFGRKTILRFISNKLCIEERDALEFIKLYCEKNIFSLNKDKIEEIIKDLSIKWQEYFNNSLDILNVDNDLISFKNIFITADDDIKELISDMISDNKFYNSLHNNFKNNVSKIESNDLLGLCDFAYGYNDPFIMIEAVAINKKINLNR